MTAGDRVPAISVVVPFFEEEESIPGFFEELLGVIDRHSLDAEVVAVDDGSGDTTWQRLSEVRARDPRVRAVRFRRNFGQTAALAAGFEAARGAAIVTMDGDLQNDPADIPALLARLSEGWDVVSGWRHQRQDDALTRVLPSRIANGMISWATDVRLHDYGCGIKAYRSEIAKSLNLYGEMHRFLPAIAGDQGARVTEMPVNHRARTLGRSKYGLSRTIRLILDLMTVKFLSNYSTRPIQVFGLLGLGGAALGLAMLFVLGAQRVFLGVELANRPIVLLAILLVVTGLQFITFGLLGEMLARTYHESQGKPVYVVRERLG
ncbi:MAG: glycosyltransferase family 2 protein [Alphaproteobacteria bacterium]